MIKVGSIVRDINKQNRITHRYMSDTGRGVMGYIVYRQQTYIPIGF